MSSLSDFIDGLWNSFIIGCYSLFEALFGAMVVSVLLWFLVIILFFVLFFTA
ncbi:MAG: hypothetical protein ABH803_01610 [Candidatus Micrarchaeota archaeon]